MHTITLQVPCDVSNGYTQLFTLPNSNGMQGFVIKTELGFSAFVNKCRHWPVPLDLEDGEVYHQGIKRIICKSHGAVYHPHTGECEAGPCSGAFLYRLPIEVESGKIVVTWSGLIQENEY